ncbi:type II secretion system protein M [Vibrio sp. SS-MA-C1-2]|uniref:type II secretion system protein GspM n=1 Tax=Vibrio sp. SS-MA-C1-2 TaxID=2908646 RepID=UPI001F25876E|nr:type II secretion system protein M [Vibrio sp. SS-MA-C1-2]UJF19450.1 type II secretion system protein M [Vibrio sp. SS-MA-C1-2]
MKQWWLALSLREKRLVIIAAVALSIATLYWGVLQPLQQREQLAQSRVQSEKQLYSWTEQQVQKIINLGGVKKGTVKSTGSFNSIVTQSLGRYKLELVRLQPRGDKLDVWVKPAPFNQLLQWLDNLQQQGISVNFIDLDRSEVSGMVEVKRLQLGRG